MTSEKAKNTIVEQFIQNLNSKKSLVDHDIIGRDEEIRQIIYILSRKIKNNPLLIGYPGVGKTAIVEGFAQRIKQGQVPDYLKNKIVYQLDIMSLMAGTKFQGELEERLKNIFKFISQPENNAVLFIDEIHLIVGAGKSQGALDFSNLLKPALSNGEIQCIGATTWEEYRQYIEKDGALTRRFSNILIEEPSSEDSVNILRGIKSNWENYFSLKIEDEALIAAVNLSKRYLSDTYLPDKAIDLIDETCGKIKSELWLEPEEIEKVRKELRNLEVEKNATPLQNKETDLIALNQEIAEKTRQLTNLSQQVEKETKVIKSLSELKNELQQQKKLLQTYQENNELEKAGQLKYSLIPQTEGKIAKLEKEAKQNTFKKYLVLPEDIAQTISRKCNLPVNKLLANEQQKLLLLHHNLSLRVKGQTQALKAIVSAIFRARSGIHNPRRPLGSFFFLGPTGVGKTEVALALAEQLFDSEDNLVRLDMSEFSEPYSLSSLIGSPPGYIGFEKENQLETVRRKPYSVVLFDEIEKAHPEIYNILLQVLDNGILTLANGQKVNFRNTIIIITSNLDSQLFFQENNMNILREEMFSRLKKHFKPEILNRLDEIVLFNPLTEEVAKEVVFKELNTFCRRVYQEKNIKLGYGKEVIEKVFKKSYSPEYGARPIRRYIEKQIGNLVSHGIIYNFLQPQNNYFLTIEEQSGEIRIKSLPLLEERNNKLLK